MLDIDINGLIYEKTDNTENSEIFKIAGYISIWKLQED